MLQRQYSESAWTGEQPDCYEPDLLSLPELPPTPPWLEKLVLGLTILFISTVAILILATIATILILFSSGFYLDRVQNHAALEWVSAALLISLVLIVVSVILDRIKKKHRQLCEMKYDNFAVHFTRSMALRKLAFSGMIIPTTTMGFMELTPSVWKQRGMTDKFGRTFFEWDHVKLTVYEYSTTRLKTLLKVCRGVNFIAFPLLGWIYVLQMITEDVFLPPYVVLLVAQTLLLFSGRLIYAGEKQTKLYEFNRHTGQVSKFDPSGNQLWSHPFSEFNVYIDYQRAESKQPACFVPYMIHRHSPHWLVKDIVSFQLPWKTHADWHSTQELIDTLIAFMNVRLPLPQCIALQACRHLDSTTDTLEPPEACNRIDFLSMSDKEYKETLSKLLSERNGIA